MMSPNARGALLMTGSQAAFVLNDTCVKVVGGAVPLFQLLVLRGVLVVVLIILLARQVGALHWRVQGRDRWLLALRCVSEMGMTYFFLTALLNMPLANVTAILQVLPLTVTLGAVLFLGEPVGWRRSAAIAVGFLGMLLIVRPGGEGFGVYTLYALAAVVCVTARDLLTRQMSGDIPSMTVTVYGAIALLLFACVMSLSVEWVPVTALDSALIIGAALSVMFGYLLSVMVMRAGDVSFTAPFRYAGLVLALLLGWLVWGDWPDGLTLLGAAIVAGTGLFTFYREQMSRR